MDKEAMNGFSSILALIFAALFVSVIWAIQDIRAKNRKNKAVQPKPMFKRYGAINWILK